jgi:putative transposase
VSARDQQSLHKPVQDQLQPTPEQERELQRTLLLCCTLDHVALQQRSSAWQRCHVAVSRSQQEAELKAKRAELPEDAALHRHVLQDVLARLDTTSQAFVRRVQAGRQTGKRASERAGLPRCKGRARFRSGTCKEDGTGARLGSTGYWLPGARHDRA